MVFEHDLHHRICDGAASHKPRQRRVTTAAGAAGPRQFHVALLICIGSHPVTLSIDISTTQHTRHIDFLHSGLHFISLPSSFTHTAILNIFCFLIQISQIRYVEMSVRGSVC